MVLLKSISVNILCVASPVSYWMNTKKVHPKRKQRTYSSCKTQIKRRTKKKYQPKGGKKENEIETDGERKGKVR